MKEKQRKSSWRETRDRLSQTAEDSRNSQAAAFWLVDAYDALSSDERIAVHPELAEWLVSDDGKLRYDARFLVRKRCIRELRPAVERAIELCESRSGVQARDEAEILRTVLVDLE